MWRLLLVLLLLLLLLLGVATAQTLPFPLNYVDERIGTGSVGWGLGQNNPAAQFPFAPLRLGPDTSLGAIHQGTHFGGYLWTDTHVQALSHTHVVGAGLPDFGNFGTMPLRVAVPTDQLITRHNYRSAHSHATEAMHPGYYSTYLETHQTLAELVAAGLNSGVHRYTYSAGGGPVTLIVDICHSVQNGAQACPEASVAFTTGANEYVYFYATIRNSAALTGRNGQGVWIYLHGRVRSSTGILRGYGIWADGVVMPNVSNRTREMSQSLGAYLYFGDASASEPAVVTFEVGISFISLALASRNLDLQLAGRSFDQALTDTTTMWASKLGGKLQVTAADERELAKYYTALYRTYMSPTDYIESDGSYLGKDNLVHFIESGRRYYSDLSLWDTYRTQNPWLNLIEPTVGGDIANALVLMYQQGDGLSRWPIANVFTSCMFGDNANMVFLDAYRKGIRAFNVSAAYEAMYKNAMGPRPRDSRGHIDAYIANGFIPLESDNTGTPNTLAYAYNDWVLAEFADLLGLAGDEAMFRARSRNWRNVFSQAELFMCARYLNGTFKCPTGFNLPYDDNFIEGNTWHYTWDVPHDLDEFVLAWPSPEAFVDKLEQNFNLSTVQFFLIEQNWLPNPYFWMGNEHDLLFPWEFSKAGRPDRTQYWTRWLLNHRFTELPDGLPGNDDYAALSAWFTFGALGLYPLTGADWYFLGSPSIDKAVLQLGGGRTLTVTAENNSPTNVYVEAVYLNGVPLNEPYITHPQLVSGAATLSFVMSSSPNTPFNLQYAQRWRAAYDSKMAHKP